MSDDLLGLSGDHSSFLYSLERLLEPSAHKSKLVYVLGILQKAGMDIFKQDPYGEIVFHLRHTVKVLKHSKE